MKELASFGYLVYGDAPFVAGLDALLSISQSGQCFMREFDHFSRLRSGIWIVISKSAFARAARFAESALASVKQLQWPSVGGPILSIPLKRHPQAQLAHDIALNSPVAGSDFYGRVRAIASKVPMGHFWRVRGVCEYASSCIRFEDTPLSSHLLDNHTY
jgi:hypothetical protein